MPFPFLKAGPRWHQLLAVQRTEDSAQAIMHRPTWRQSQGRPPGIPRSPRITALGTPPAAPNPPPKTRNLKVVKRGGLQNPNSIDQLLAAYRTLYCGQGGMTTTEQHQTPKATLLENMRQPNTRLASCTQIGGAHNLCTRRRCTCLGTN